MARIPAGRTGNPFVDCGLAVAAVMKGLPGADAVTDDALRDVIGEGTEIARLQQRLKAFNLVFGSNTPLHNPKPKGRKPGEQHVKRYAQLLVSLANVLGHEARPAPCEICGAAKALGDHQLPTTAPTAGKRPQADSMVGRDWFPLVGAKTEANLLPAGSRSIHACARCLLAVRLLPYAIVLVDGQACILQSAPPSFADQFVADLYDHVRERCAAGNYETIGAKEGTRALVRRLLAVLDSLRAKAGLRGIDARTRLFAWKFSNAGEKGGATVEEIPNRALTFLRDAIHLRRELESLIGRERGKDTLRTPSLLRCLESGIDYAGLYPGGDHPGASPELFDLYQIKVLGRTASALAVRKGRCVEVGCARTQ